MTLSNIQRLTELTNDFVELEGKRLQKLKSLQLLDTPTENSFDNITKLLALILDVPIALVSLIDGKRQWFKSKHGLAVSETPREISFCTHVVDSRDNKELVIENALNDKRFQFNPLVISDPHIRFYLGYPIMIDDLCVGTLCAIDREPRKINDKDLEAIKLLTNQAVHLINIRKHTVSLLSYIRL